MIIAGYIWINRSNDKSLINEVISTMVVTIGHYTYTSTTFWRRTRNTMKLREIIFGKRADEKKEDNTKQKDISKELEEHYENGLSHPYLFVGQNEAVTEAANLTSVFAFGEANFAEMMVTIHHAGKYVGCINNPDIQEKFNRIYRRCARGIHLNDDDMQFIAYAISGRFY